MDLLSPVACANIPVGSAINPFLEFSSHGPAFSGGHSNLLVDIPVVRFPKVPGFVNDSFHKQRIIKPAKRCKNIEVVLVFGLATRRHSAFITFKDIVGFQSLNCFPSLALPV